MWQCYLHQFICQLKHSVFRLQRRRCLYYFQYKQEIQYWIWKCYQNDKTQTMICLIINQTTNFLMFCKMNIDQSNMIMEFLNIYQQNGFILTTLVFQTTLLKTHLLYNIYILMFLFNLFGKSNSNNQDQRFDKITFKINLKDNVPQYFDWSEQHIQQEEQLTPDHPLYHTIFPKEEQKYVQYIANENDTLFGIAMKLDINESVIKQINNISGNIYPGMNIKLPEGTDLSKLQQYTVDQTTKMRISQLLRGRDKSQEFINLIYNVEYYVGQSGHIRGKITINSNYLIFNPSLDDPKNIQNFTVQRLLKFNAIVQTVDIQDIIFMQLPEMSDNEIPNSIAVVQFLLYRVGNYKIQKKYKQKLKQLKIDQKAIASMSFTVLDSQQKSSKQLGNELVDKVKYMLKQLSQNQKDIQENLQKNKLTNIPFFDIIHQNINPKVPEEKVESFKVLHKSAILGTFSQPSQILTAQQFHYIVQEVPVIYKLSNWVKAYSKIRDGTSFTSFCNKTSNVEPAIMLIKEYKGYRFGAYLTSEIRAGKSGRGQMFIFSFKQKEVPQIHQWTGKNEFFVYFDKQDGLGIGMGFKYGIWIKGDFYKGSTSHTKTFGNTDILSKKQDFLIEQIQIWAVDSSY